VADLRGIGKQMPMILWCFAFLALTLVGIPPMGGFTGKWHLIAGSLAANTGFLTWLGPVVLLLSAMLSAGYLFPIVINGFLPGIEHDCGKLDNKGNQGNKEPGFSMLIPVLLLTVIAVILGIFPNALISLLEQAVGGLL